MGTEIDIDTQTREGSRFKQIHDFMEEVKSFDPKTLTAVIRLPLSLGKEVSLLLDDDKKLELLTNEYEMAKSAYIRSLEERIDCIKNN